MKLKRTLSLIISVVMLVSLFSACGGKDVVTDVGTLTAAEIKEFEKAAGGLKLPFDKKGTTISVYTPTSNVNLSDTLVPKELSRRTGLNVQIMEVAKSVADQKLKTLYASKDTIPDIVTTGFKTTEIYDLGDQGAFADVMEYKDELPNFKRYFIDEAEENGTKDYFKKFNSATGKMYFFPSFGTPNTVQHGMLYRKDIFDKHGIEMWNSPEEFYQVLKKLKELYPNSTPFTSKTGMTFFQNMGMMWGVPNFPYDSFNFDTRTWEYTIFTDEFKEVLEFTKKLYDEGLLDPEFLTLTQAAWTSKMTQADKAFVTYDWIGRLEQFVAQSTIPGYDIRYGNPIGPEQKIGKRGGSGIKAPVKNSEKTLLALKLCDYLLSDGGAELLHLGVEGVSFEWANDEHTKVRYFLDEGEQADEDTMERKWGISMSSLTFKWDQRCWYFEYTEREQEAQDLMFNKPNGGFFDSQPGHFYNAEEKNIVDQYTSQIEKMSQEFAVQYVLNGKNSQADWDAFEKKVKAAGYDKVIKAKNDAQVRRDAEYK